MQKNAFFTPCTSLVSFFIYFCLAAKIGGASEKSKYNFVFRSACTIFAEQNRNPLIMNTRYLLISTLLAIVLLAGCRSDGGKTSTRHFAFLDSLDIAVDDDLMLPDTLTLPDIYCGDPEQTVDDLKGFQLNKEQYAALLKPAGRGFADRMSNWMLLGLRDVGGGNTLGGFYVCNGVGYCVELITYDRQGKVLDAINTREMHVLWRINLSDIDNDTIFTLDSYLTFEGPNRLTLHRTMGRCIMDFDKDIKGAPFWQQQWAQDYTINEKGHFVLHGQQVIDEKGEVDYYAALDFKSWDMLVCSRHDPGIMDIWNDYTDLVNSTYDPDYQYNPFPWDVAMLYRMNPQRFLQWMAAHRDSGNRLLPLFKLPPDDRPALLQEIARIDDPSARQWLTDLVNAWDNKPLTRHL